MRTEGGLKDVLGRTAIACFFLFFIVRATGSTVTSEERNPGSRHRGDRHNRAIYIVAFGERYAEAYSSPGAIIVKTPFELKNLSAPF